MTTNSHRIIVGVDFGTTYTGLSWVHTATKCSTIQDIFIINDWDGNEPRGRYNCKAPSVIAYENENPSCNLRGDKWGFQVMPSMTSYTWMKLHLDNGQAMRYSDEPFQDLPLHSSRTAEEIVTNFLSHLYRFLIGTLERDVRRSRFPRLLPIDFWFTTPAIWSDEANNATRRAAQAAGFGSRPEDDVYILPEPEAAAVAVLKDLTSNGSNFAVQQGNCVLICDCGGGTVDLTTYKVTSARPTLQFEELSGGSGGKCGSIYIDRRFLNWMSQTFGTAFDRLDNKFKSPGSRLMDEFESAKRAFSGDQSVTFELTLWMDGVPHSRLYDASLYKVKVEWSIMRDFFQPPVDKITSLVQEQVQQAASMGEKVHNVVLVGGFGSSEYLYTHLRVCFSQWQIGVLRPVNPTDSQTVIVKGAALRGVENFKARRNRGSFEGAGESQAAA